MAHYVDGFVLPIAEDKVEAYRALATQTAAIWKEHGALQYYECVGDDLLVTGQRSFYELAGTVPGETVVFAWVVYESREARDRIMAAVMADTRLACSMEGQPLPFDINRMAYGGFKTIVTA